MTLILSGTNGLSDVNGSAAAPAITGTDTDTGVFFGTNTVSLSTGGTERLQVDSSGNLGLGVTPSAWVSSVRALDVGSGGGFVYAGDFTVAYNAYTNGANWIYKTTNGAARYTQGTSGQHVWYSAASGTAGNAITFTQAMTLDASGNLGVGTTSPNARLHLNTSGSSIGLTLQCSGGYGYVFNDGTYVSLASDNGSTGLKFRVARAAPDNAATIDSSGNLLLATTTVTSVGWLQTTSSNAKYAWVDRASVSNSGNPAGFFNSAGTNVGGIATSNTATTYSTGSDYRLKEVSGSLVGYKERLSALQPKQGTWKADGSEFRGFLAHEFAESYPTSVTGAKDAVDVDGNPQYQGMQAGSAEVIADLVAMIQEQQAIITQLQADVQALKGNA